MMLSVHRNHKAYYGPGERGEKRGEAVGVGGEGGGGMEVGGDGDYIPIAILSPPE